MSTTDTTDTTTTVYTVTCGPSFTACGHDGADFTQWEGDEPITKAELEALVRQSGGTDLEWTDDLAWRGELTATAIYPSGDAYEPDGVVCFALAAVERCPGCADWLTADDRDDDAGRCADCALDAWAAVLADDDEPGEAPEALEVPTTADHLGSAVADAISSINYALELIDPAERVKRGQMLAARHYIEAAFPNQADEAAQF